MPRTVTSRAAPDFNSSCETFTQNTTVTFQNYTIGFASGTCPLGNCNATKRATLERRDPICSTGNCERYSNLPLDEKLLVW